MLKLAIGVFILAALFGLTVLLKILKNMATPKVAVFFHGLFAASALLLVLMYAYLNPQHAPYLSIVLFLIAAIGGFTLLSFDLRQKVIPKAIALAHPALAVLGLLSLIYFVFM